MAFTQWSAVIFASVEMLEVRSQRSHGIGDIALFNIRVESINGYANAWITDLFDTET